VFAAADLYIMNADGTGVTAVGNSINAGRPSWSPAGDSIIYTDLGPTVIYSVAPDGSGKHIVHASSSEPVDSPDWSPDATQIAFSEGSSSSSLPEIRVMNADGTNVHAISGPND